MKKSILIAMLACSVAAWGQLAKVKQMTGLDRIGKGGDKNQAEESRDSGANEASTEVELDDSIEAYRELRFFAQGLYSRLEGPDGKKTSSSFKRQVDSAYDELQRNDAKRAFEMNVSAHSEVHYVVEDRFRIYSGLYENPVVQSFANRVGQSIVPTSISRQFTFKLVADPVPWAQSLSTGTVWVSTGMVALTNNKAELAYVLAHEAAHVYLGHHKNDIMLNLAQGEYNKWAKENGSARTKSYSGRGGWLGAVTGATIGVFSGGVKGAIVGASGGAALGGAAGAVYANMTNTRVNLNMDWNSIEESEADKVAFSWMLEAKQNITSVPTIFRALREAGDRDPRVRLGFLGRSDHVRERIKAVESWIEYERKQPDWDSKVISQNDPSFDLLLAEVKRDNGVYAFHYDMLDLAKKNLEDAVAIKTQDPTALYFYGKVLAQTGRTDAERKKADEYFLRASQCDYRNQNYGSFLNRALVLMAKESLSSSEKSEVVDLLKQYLLGYHFSKADTELTKSDYPPHLEIVYDYMARMDEFKWLMNDEVIKRAAQQRAAGVPLINFKDVIQPINQPAVAKPDSQDGQKQVVKKPAQSKKAANPKAAANSTGN